jgi:hypothetical protein
MTYSELAFFAGVPCQHVAAWQEHKRLQRIMQRARQLTKRERRARPRYC